MPYKKLVLKLSKVLPLKEFHSGSVGPTLLTLREGGIFVIGTWMICLETDLCSGHNKSK